MPALAKVTIASLCVSAAAQQFAGDTVSRSLPTKDGSEIAYFRVSDPSGANDQFTLNYYSLNSSGQRLQESAVERAVIMNIGQNRNAADYEGFVMDALEKFTTGASIDNTAIMTPMWANDQDKNVAHPWDDQSQSSTSNVLVWYDAEWAYGRNNMYPSSSRNISTFYALDEVVRYYLDEDAFPNLKEIVVAGHSMGSQLVQRYAALTTIESGRIPVTFWPTDPNLLVWLSADHPVDTSDCPTFDDYPEGFSNYEQDNQQYGVSLVNQGVEAVRQNFQNKQVAWLRSIQDHGDHTTDGCGAYASGANRDERFLNFIKAFPPQCDDPSGGNCDVVDYIDASHDAAAAFGSEAGPARLFTDNFDGQGVRAHDFGERRQDGDDPYPSS